VCPQESRNSPPGRVSASDDDEPIESFDLPDPICGVLLILTLISSARIELLRRFGNLNFDEIQNVCNSLSNGMCVRVSIRIEQVFGNLIISPQLRAQIFIESSRNWFLVLIKILICTLTMLFSVSSIRNDIFF